MELLISFIAGALALAGYQVFRSMKRGASIKQAVGIVISGGGGPGSGETPK